MGTYRDRAGVVGAEVVVEPGGIEPPTSTMPL